MKPAQGLLGLTALLPFVAARANCPLYGPLLPLPKNLLLEPAIYGVAGALNDVFHNAIDNDTSTGSERFSYAVEVFSGSEDRPLWARYWTAPNLATLNTTGVREIDGNTVFRIGSVTKIYTVLAFLATVGDGVWNDPVTKYVPELAEIAAKNMGRSPIYATDWESITVGSLASQTSGLIRDYALLGELSYQMNLTDLHPLGFPPLPLESFPPCGSWPTCNRTQLYEGLSRLPPSFPPFVTPAYSDLNFVLLAHIAEQITGKPWKQLLEDSVLKPLGLKHTFYETPEDELGVIPGSRFATSWAGNLGEESATGNMYTSASDMSAFGRAILRSTLIKPAMTRRWLKPASFSSDPRAAVGMPWGIRRVQLEKNGTYQFVHTFNKLGSIGSYSAMLALIPELDLGFSILAAGVVPAGLPTGIAEALSETYISTMTWIARSQATATYAGRYVHESLLALENGSDTLPKMDNDTAPFLNSSLTITVDPSVPGLGVEAWFSNGTDMSLVATAITANVSSEYFAMLQPSVRLYPTGLEETSGGNETLPDGRVVARKVAFKAVFEDISAPDMPGGNYVTECASWVGVTGVVYGSIPLDLFVFEFGEDGKVVAVVNEGLRVRLVKVG
ncbi:hypothetical protein VTJ83DRAFT_3796 [Remersonia thermophila]|uniref:Beta-lactamase-related domain-containing protein n=1 Tax=Remersonia thermophila TaxID=72144 RepID=A0ABR4DFM4_9PEZI